MLNLLKYNWRKSDVLFYSLTGVTLLLYALLYILTTTAGWWAEVSLLIAFAFTGLVLQVLTIVVIYNFNGSLKSITRRLLPVGATKEYIAYLIVPVVYQVVFSILLWLFFLVFNPQFRLEGLTLFFNEINKLEASLSILIMTLATSIFASVVQFLAVAIARLFRTNLRILIFIAIIIGISVVYGVVTGYLQSLDPTLATVTQEGIIRVNIALDSTVTNIESVTINWFSFHWIQIVNVALTLIMALITVYIIKNKIEV